MGVILGDNCVKKIWITTLWESNPLMGERSRLERANQLANFLSSQGYDVTLWFTTFQHSDKKYIHNKSKIVDINEKLHMVLVHCPIPYKKNTSPIRFLHLSMIAREMKRLIKNKTQFPTPDLIFCSYPPEQYCKVSLDYAEKHNIPVVIDARDLWPDIFERAIPQKLRFLSGMILSPMKRRTTSVFKRANAICAMSPATFAWALNYAEREQTELDRYIFIGSEYKEPEQDVLCANLKEWEEKGITKETWNVCLFTVLSKTSQDIDTVIDAVKKIHDIYPQIRFVVGGTGDDFDRLLELTKNISYILFCGWLNKDQMTSLMYISKVGMLCYRNTQDFKDGWGNKVGQYLSYGLPYLKSATGVAKAYAEQYGCGLAYKEGDSIELASCIQSLIEDDEKYKRLSGNASACFMRDFESNAINARFEQMINEVYDNHYKID